MVHLLVRGARVARFALFSFGLLWLLVLLHSTWIRAVLWQSEKSLWLEAAQRSPKLPRPHINLGLIYEREQNYTGALKEFMAARWWASIDGRDPKHQLMSKAAAESNIALIRLIQGRYQAAIYMASKALEDFPELSAAYVNRGTAYLAMGQCRLAIEDYVKAGVPDLPRCKYK